MRVCVIPGDGIGPEVLGVATRVLQVLVPSVEFTEAAAGWATFERHGVALPTATLEAAKAADAILFGAVASPSHNVPGYRSPIVQLRRELDLYANIRPTQVRTSDHSLVVVRENTEGLYAGRERLEDDGATAIAERVITRQASARIVRAACELARRRANDLQRPGRVTIVHKANVLRVSDGLFRETALAVVGEYPDLSHDELLVDVAAMHLAQNPSRFDVIVTTNMFGDILSDVACIHGGGLGLAASANFGDERALFEPVHGAAPDIVGRGIANPLAALECVAMLLTWRGYAPEAARLRHASAAMLRDGPHTPDLGGNATTEELAADLMSVMSDK
ncbi:MAG: isocitrate/isopropylmalate dehydrogenase family protein [Candidatus Viridilinea halotolerans]|uniref:Isocitrate/isopropylmalate dehydrogenase family protein n=1 Tax=Candidatus Viridilinea halotolerans TaxID=2491704 RepID=A0A426TV67_9CHLR|nr:MAG: isocitrate/isopropylmalate dehydrogenase family protein [Candidatus Viridilinea halotolerans]